MSPAPQPTTLDRTGLLAAARAVPDPEIPVLTLGDLGIVRDLRVTGDAVVEVDITPTYTGCPATAVIAADVRAVLERAVRKQADAAEVRVRTVLSPPWTTDWMTEAGRDKLREFGIAPPGPATHPAHSAYPGGPVPLTISARCPHCGSGDTREVSRFGSTPCKSLWTCRSCAEPFDSFKAI